MIYWRTDAKMTSPLTVFCFFVSYKTNRFNVPVGLYRKRSKKTSKCCKNISDTLDCASCPPPPSPPYFDVICEQTHGNMESSCGQLTRKARRILFVWVYTDIYEYTGVSLSTQGYQWVCMSTLRCPWLSSGLREHTRVPGQENLFYLCMWRRSTFSLKLSQ